MKSIININVIKIVKRTGIPGQIFILLTDDKKTDDLHNHLKSGLLYRSSEEYTKFFKIPGEIYRVAHAYKSGNLVYIRILDEDETPDQTYISSIKFNNDNNKLNAISKVANQLRLYFNYNHLGNNTNLLNINYNDTNIILNYDWNPTEE